ncbi:MAG: helix-turn-helix domain-containing protein [Ruthenibacterium sp.]
MSTAEKIVLLRKKKGISQEELAHELNTSRQAISKWENAQSTPDLDKLVSLSKYFGVSTDYLLKDCAEAAADGSRRCEVNAEAQKLKLEVTAEEYQYAADEAKRKKHFSYWVPVISSFIVILAVFLSYYCFYC